MCGIVGVISQRNVVDILLEGLTRLEYRGYDSAGVAVVTDEKKLERVRSLGKIADLRNALSKTPIDGKIGIAHTRWATHGKPSVHNAHPHTSGTIAIVHNGIIENYQELKDKLIAQGYEFASETDTEVIAHLIHYHRYGANAKALTLLSATMEAVKELKGAYGIAVIDSNEPDKLVVSRFGSPLVIGIGINEHYVASDQLALLLVTNKFCFLENGDIAELSIKNVNIFDKNGNKVERKIDKSNVMYDASDKQGYKHYMLKEIFEQPKIVQDILAGRIKDNSIDLNEFGYQAQEIFSKTQAIQIVACGTSYHAGLVAKNWIESKLNIPCFVDIASEYRYKKNIVLPNTLLITISQSGETADTLAALRLARELGYIGTLAICNVLSSSLVRESDLAFMTCAGAEIGVASTKAFIAQLVSFLLLTCALGQVKSILSPSEIKEIIKDLRVTSSYIEQILSLNKTIEKTAEKLYEKSNAIFLGRGTLWPIAMEGALKLKEISYIHAEAYAAGELKHGPIALIDENMPVICVAPSNNLIEKLISNIQVVKARKGEIFVFTDNTSELDKKLETSSTHIIILPKVSEMIEPIIYTIPLQLIAYYVSSLRGYDVDQPRNLAKSVTVE
ncbi:MAG: glutamine--fructose-6-phosphate transaminase (isomerizing) [Succinivibrionaceae bacterium]